MDMSQAATFLGASILISIGVIIIAILLLILNNLFSMFWKPVRVLRFHDPYARPYEQSEPLMEKVQPSLESIVEKPSYSRKK